ncbi:rano class II histocompatibility antigen, A beta chain-like [Clupea harengus]|uniref:Rano class II histocompatibility antigen, A beta chain-like n=1 Tax=Clupea harengus TaxID=7950 RepID=A0A6P8FJA1_CLUHA|nr:rano class II histocompatibility antigen, A beta chain-like [Clupea harengus]
MSRSRLICACLLPLVYLLLGVDGYCQYRWIRCYSNSMSLTDMVFVESYFYNKMEFLVFNSTVGRYVGYSDFGMALAHQKNEDKHLLPYEQGSVDRLCKVNALVYKSHGMDKTMEPSVNLNLVRPVSSNHVAMLMCSAYNFYPRMIRVTWYRDGQKVTSDVSATEELADGDWFYQIHSHLEFTPKAGEKISCVVEHASFKEPREFVWDSSMPKAERNKIAIGAAGLLLGLVVCAAGLLYYRKTSRGWILAPQRSTPTH